MKCGTPNPNQASSADTHADFSYDGTVTCWNCQAINVGNHTASSFSRKPMTSIPDFCFLACEFCGILFDHPNRSAKRSRPMRDPRSHPDRRHHFSSVIRDRSRAQKTDKPLRPVEAVEKPMDVDELERYYYQYLSAVQEQREQPKSLTENQLHALVMQLFQSLQYSNHQADGE